MKSLFKIGTFLITGLCLAFAGCYKDDSTEANIQINELSLSDTAASKRINILFNDTLKLKPVLSQALGSDVSRLKFVWKAYDNSATQSYIVPFDTLGYAHELKAFIEAPFVLGSDYRVTLTVTDTVAQTSAFISYNITINNIYGQGLMVLEDKAGTGDISFIFPDQSVEHGLYTKLNTTPLIKPRKLELTPFGVTDDISSSGKRLYILAESGSQEYNYTTMMKKFNFDVLFFNPPAVMNPQRITWVSSSTNLNSMSASLGVAINNNWVHSNLVGGFPGTKKWGAATVTPGQSGNLNYSLAPYIAGGTTYTAVVYDNLGKRFWSVGGNNLVAFPSTASTEFDMNNVGMEMIFMDSASVVRNYNAVMKGSDGFPYLLRFTTAANPATLGKLQMNAPGILSLKAATGATLTPHLYYSGDNVIRKYETTSNTTTDAYTFPASEQITFMKYQKAIPNGTGSRIMVATWNGTEGKLYYFPTTLTGELEPYTNVFSGFGKIVDAAYKVP
ncbi:MAG: PKD-like family lipoprotein [Chitinophagaceae bacterium]